METVERFGGLQIYCEVELDLVSRSTEEQDEQELGPSSGGRSSKLSGRHLTMSAFGKVRLQKSLPMH